MMVLIEDFDAKLDLTGGFRRCICWPLVTLRFWRSGTGFWGRDAGKNETSITTWWFGLQNQWCPSPCFEAMGYNGTDEISGANLDDNFATC
jgi:hypothetical protein